MTVTESSGALLTIFNAPTSNPSQSRETKFTISFKVEYLFCLNFFFPLVDSLIDVTLAGSISFCAEKRF